MSPTYFISHPPKLLLNPLNCLVHLLPSRHIRLVEFDLDTLGCPYLRETCIRFDNIKDSDFCASFSGGLGKGETEAAGCAGRDGGLVFSVADERGFTEFVVGGVISTSRREISQ